MTRVNRFLVLLCAGLFALLLAAPTSQAYAVWFYRYHTTGTTLNIPYRWGSNLGSSTNIWRVAFQNGINNWNTRPTKPRFVLGSSSAPNVINTYSANDGAYGYCQAYTDGAGKMVGSDIMGNTYTTSGFTSVMRQSTAGHELGHSIGLAHSTVTPALMNTSRNRSTTYTAQTDDVNGVNYMYK